LLKVACSGPGVSRTRNLLVTSPILYQLDHCTHQLGIMVPNLNCICLFDLVILYVLYKVEVDFTHVFLVYANAGA